MSLEDQDLLARINLLSGKIDQVKNKSVQGYPTNTTSPSATEHNFRGYPYPNIGWRGRGRGRGQTRYSPAGYRGGKTSQIHRNRTLIMNNNQTTPNNSQNDGEEVTKDSPTWVSRTGRHMQLINKSIYEQDAPKRIEAIEQTRQQRLKLKHERERSRFNAQLDRMNGRATQNRTQEIDVQGVRFVVTKGGSKLVKVPDDVNAAKSTPKTAIVLDSTFHRSKNGNMYIAGIVRAQRKRGIKKTNEPCKVFSTTGMQERHELQLTTLSTGTCLKGPRCRHIHDPSKVAVCKDFLAKGICPSGDSCDLSHELTPERTPTCMHFTRGTCSKSDCRYPHVGVSPSALVCRPFGIYGYCEKGANCTERHISYECPDFTNTGTCTTKGCKLLHREKASVMRNKAAHHASATSEDESDLSSDDEAIDSDDVDSDDLGEFFGDDDGPADTDIPMQQDFVQLS